MVRRMGWALLEVCRREVSISREESAAFDDGEHVGEKISGAKRFSFGGSGAFYRTKYAVVLHSHCFAGE